MSDARPVWLTREQRDLLQAVLESRAPGQLRRDVLRSVVAAWDNAPADSTEAAYEALSPYTRSYRQWNERATEDVLRALGMPDG